MFSLLFPIYSIFKGFAMSHWILHIFFVRTANLSSGERSYSSPKQRLKETTRVADILVFTFQIQTLLQELAICYLWKEMAPWGYNTFSTLMKGVGILSRTVYLVREGRFKVRHIGSVCWHTSKITRLESLRKEIILVRPTWARNLRLRKKKNIKQARFNQEKKLWFCMQARF